SSSMPNPLATSTFCSTNASKFLLPPTSPPEIARPFVLHGLNVTDEDIESTWAGIRPLIYEEGKDPSEISRKDEIWEGKSGLL
ncbi:hypothetical protein IDG63_14490, partial [Staphylococcus sp. EG-SA-14]|nr:hypothetical protein [Staphylococcus sp. EG-SA-14]